MDINYLMMNGTVHQIKCGMIVHNMAKRTELKNGAVLGEGIELGEGSTVVHGPGYHIRSYVHLHLRKSEISTRERERCRYISYT